MFKKSRCLFCFLFCSLFLFFSRDIPLRIHVQFQYKNTVNKFNVYDTYHGFVFIGFTLNERADKLKSLKKFFFPFLIYMIRQRL